MIELLKAVLGGITLSLGGAAWLWLADENPLGGALVFALGLLVVFVLDLELYTNRAGLLVEQSRETVAAWCLSLVKILVGNLMGAAWTGTGLLATRLSVRMSEAAVDMTMAKLTDRYSSIFLLAVFCGMLMFIAAECWRRGKDPLSRVLPVVLCGAAMAVTGFDHCVVDLFIFSLSGGLYTHQGLWALAISAVGNLVGALVISLPLLKLTEEYE